MRRYAWLLAATLMAACGGGKDDVYIALPSDFAPFRSWTRVSLGDAMRVLHENAIITPHIAGRSDQDAGRMVGTIQENIRRFVAGKPLINVVDKKKGY